MPEFAHFARLPILSRPDRALQKADRSPYCLATDC
jgi:hypothetical protein